jgi:predicted Zn-dependent protease
MAHEMVHADRKHGLRMAAKANQVTLAALAVMLLSGGAAAPIVLAQVAQVAITNSYTMELEIEADSVGLDVLVEAGYPPAGMITLMERFMNEEFKQPIIEYGIYMNHPSSRARIDAAMKKLKSLGLPVERKRSLGLLRTDVKEDGGRIVLTVDNAPVWSGKATPETREAVTKAQTAIDKYLQMETAPYDVHIVGEGLYIGNALVTGSVNGMENPGSFRKALLKSMDAARRKHPAAKYFQ